MDSLSGAVLKFSHKLLEKMLKDGETNLFISPCSILLVMKMVLEGAEGETKTQLEEALNVAKGDVSKELKEAVTAILNSKEYEMKIANGVFQDKSFEIKKKYMETLTTWFNAKMEAVDFKNNAEATTKHINDWVNNQTNGKIDNLFGQGSLTSSTAMVLANAIYFKGMWEKAFEKANTRDADFHVSKNKTTKVNMMHTHGKFKFAQNSEKKCKVLEIDYKGCCSLIVVLPDDPEGARALHSSMTPEEVVTWMKAGNMQETDVNLNFPIIEMNGDYDLVKYLTLLGIKNLFENADLSGISDTTGLTCSGVKHKTYLKINEEGTEAAAATGVTVSVTSIQIPQEFIADHPFIFYIVYKPCLLVLFQGICFSP